MVCRETTTETVVRAHGVFFSFDVLLASVLGLVEGMLVDVFGDLWYGRCFRRRRRFRRSWPLFCYCTSSSSQSFCSLRPL
jgi:hypothetical protein